MKELENPFNYNNTNKIDGGQIERQENIVTILSQFLDEIEADDRIIKYRKLGQSTAWERNAIGNALEKLLALDNLKVTPID